MKQINRRQFMKNACLSLAGTLIFPKNVYASKPNIFAKYSERELLARMIFGEARNCIFDEKIWIGLTPINRINDGKKYTGQDSIKNILLKPKQYDCFDIRRTNRENYKKIIHPEKYEPKAWEESLFVSTIILNDGLNYPNYRQTHYCKKELIGRLLEGKLKVNPEKIELINSLKKFKHQFYREI